MNVGSPHDSNMPSSSRPVFTLTPKEWQYMLSQVRKLMNPLLDQLSLKRLADCNLPIEVLKSPHQSVCIKKGPWKLGPDRLLNAAGSTLDDPANLQGIYFCFTHGFDSNSGNFNISIFGLSRACEWVSVETEHSCTQDGDSLDTVISKAYARSMGSDEDFVNEVARHTREYDLFLKLLLEGLRRKTEVEADKLKIKPDRARNMAVSLETMLHYASTGAFTTIRLHT